MKTKIKQDYYYAKDSLENTQEILRRLSTLFEQGERIDAKVDELLKIMKKPLIWEK